MENYLLLIVGILLSVLGAVNRPSPVPMKSTAGFARKFLSISYPTRRTRKNACLIHTWPYGTAFPHSGQRVFRLLRQPLSEISA